MADGLSVAASALQVADLGFRLAKTIWVYAKDVRSAAADLHAVATDVDILAKVLKQLHNQLDLDHQSRLYTREGRETAYENLQGCRQAFVDIEKFLVDFVRKDSRNGKARLSKRSQMMYPLKQGRMEVLRANLERLKSTMVLNLSVLALRVQTSTHGQHVDLSLTRLQIESMIKANEEMARRFDEMKKAYRIHCQQFNAGPDTMSMLTVLGPPMGDNDKGLPDSDEDVIPGASQSGPRDTALRITRKDHMELAAKLLPPCAQAATTLATTIAVATFSLQTEQCLDMGKIRGTLRDAHLAVQDLERGIRQPLTLVTASSRDDARKQREARQSAAFMNEERKRVEMQARLREEALAKERKMMRESKTKQEGESQNYLEPTRPSYQSAASEGFFRDDHGDDRYHDEDDEDDWDEGHTPSEIDLHSSGLDVVDELLQRWTRSF